MTFKQWLTAKIKVLTAPMKEGEIDALVGGIAAEFAFFVLCVLANSAA